MSESPRFDSVLNFRMEEYSDASENRAKLYRSRVPDHKRASIVCSHGELTLIVPAEDLVETLRALRDSKEAGFTILSDLTAVHYPDREERPFSVVYQLQAIVPRHRLRVKVLVGELDWVETAIPVYPNANWYEREVWDMFGIPFQGHPDLRRILTDYGFRGHPLRKDFPLTGFTEVRYDEVLKRVVMEPLALSQEMRNFNLASPWNWTTYSGPELK